MHFVVTFVVKFVNYFLSYISRKVTSFFIYCFLALSVHISFVVYEVIKPSLLPSDQVIYANHYGFTFCKNIYKDNATNQLLSEILVDCRENYEYQIDGLVVTDNNIYALHTE